MSHGFSILPFRQLVEIVLNQLDNNDSFFNIPADVFFVPNSNDIFRIQRFGQMLETPTGTAAGPHTQMTQNIVAAWLCGARYIELKTIQTLDELQVSKPCIDMQGEGYNCEWSQELKIKESFDQYLNAWILLHLLKDKLGHPKEQGLGIIFNMSIGYDLKGILQKNVQWFLDRMKDCSIEKALKIKEIQDIYPRIKEIKIPDRISDNVTLSTMHGCPPDEIEKIGLYLIQERKLNTIIKLNPTLLGKEKLNFILKNSGFEIIVPDEAFEHDLKYKDAIQIINNLQNAATKNSVHFGLKLTNTLESLNNKTVLPATEKTMYMSGRALHPIAINLAAKLQNDFDGKLDISFSAGLNNFNLHKVLSCGLSPATVCTDLLKPGGYGLLNQYLVSLGNEIRGTGANSLEDYILKTSGQENITIGAHENLKKYADEVITQDDYKQTRFQKPDIKTERQLGFFDCIQAPCVDTCPTNQDIPDYLFFTAQGKLKNAFDAIFRTNPFPNTTGMICDHPCQTKCTRMNYDDPLLIREIKRAVAENFSGHITPEKHSLNGKKVAIIGAGPSGLSCAHYLNLAGFQVDVYETKSVSGGMVEEVIPEFRLKRDSLNKDLKRIEKSGIRIFYDKKVDSNLFSNIKGDYDFIYISTGAWSSRKFAIEGINSKGVFDPVKFLAKAKQGKATEIGNNIAVIGGGNTALDAARTALRLSGTNGKVTILYRRSKGLMPADPDEIITAQDEGISIFDLTLPVRVNTVNDKVKSLTCVKIRLEQKTGSGRPLPVEIPGSEFDLEFDTVIPAIGQDAAFDFLDEKITTTNSDSYETQNQNVFIGGDAKRGGSTVIQAIADGRKTAGVIIEKSGIQTDVVKTERTISDYTNLMLKRMVRQKAIPIPEIPILDRNNFNLVTNTISTAQAQAEASRCLLCDELCNSCVTVCPNLACFSYQIEPVKFHLQKIILIDGTPMIEDDKPFEVRQKYQILHIADWCNDCGNCSTFCPTAEAPYLKKPYLFINKKSFDECESGYYFDPENRELLLKNKNMNYSIIKTTDNYYFIKGSDSVVLNKDTFKIIDFDLREPATINLRVAAEMSVILTGAEKFWNGKNI